MKIGLITIMDYTNYGNRLQNYAAYRFFADEMHCNVKSLVSLKNKPFENRNYKIWIKNKIMQSLCAFPGFVEKRYGPERTRAANFIKWSSKIPTETFYDCSALPEILNDKYDYFFVGSDQVWNCSFPAFKENDYLLKFADNSKKCSLSASFGFETIPEDKHEVFKREINKFRHISVREDAGQRIIKNLIGRNVPVLVDPVMMLDEKEWMSVSKKPRVDMSRPYVLKYYLGDKSEEDEIERWAETNGYIVYELLDKSKPELYSAGPGEFLSLIKNAALICSDSFHCIAFSILFKKPFVVYSRKGEENYMTSRLDTLLGKFGFEDRWNNKLNENEYLQCDYSGFDRKLGKERQAFRDYVSSILESENDKSVMPELADRSLCTGCSACEAVCPVNCIQMIGDQNDFAYPEIADPSVCIHCGQCEKTCPVINRKTCSDTPEAYAVMSMNPEIRNESSSGGIFSEAANIVLSENGIVFGAMFDESFNVVHGSVENKVDLYKLRGAKYSESKIEGILKKVESELKIGRKVLFSGTPCQVAGLKSYLRKDYDNLICIDFVCHGIPSPMVWKEYVKQRSDIDNHGEKPIGINMRSKKTGWSRYNYSNEFVYKDKTFSSVSGENEFMNLFVSDYINRESCSSCVFKGYSRVSDLTIGDFWGIWDLYPDMDDNKGTSVVLIQSDKGTDIFNRIKSSIVYKEVTLEDASRYNPSMIKASEARMNRREKLESIRNSGIQ